MRILVILAIVVAWIAVGPVLLLWSINSLAAAGGSSFYIEHGLWNWFVAFVVLLLVRGGSSSAK